MEPRRDVPHQFDLAGAKVGDWFLGCPACWFRLGFRVAGAGGCPECSTRMDVFTVTEHDMKPREGQ